MSSSNLLPFRCAHALHNLLHAAGTPETSPSVKFLPFPSPPIHWCFQSHSLMESNCSKRDSAVSSTWRGSHVSRWLHLSLHQTRPLCSNKNHKSTKIVFQGTRRKEAKEAGGAITKYWCFRSSWLSPIASLSLVFGQQRWPNVGQPLWSKHLDLYGSECRFGSLDSQDSPQICSRELNQTTAAVLTCFLRYIYASGFWLAPATSVKVHPYSTVPINT